MAAFIRIDSDKLNYEFKKRDLNKTDVSEEVGHNRNYFTDILRKGTMPKYMTVTLLKNYNIRLEDYELTEPKEKPRREERFLKDMTDKQVYQLMYSAVYHAVKKAWSE